MADEKEQGSAEDRSDRLEGMLIAHRKILAQIVTLMQEQGDTSFIYKLDERSVMRDGQEDPGAVPTDGVATGLAIAEEVSRIVSLARANGQSQPD